MYCSNFNKEEKLWSNLSTLPTEKSNVSLGSMILTALSLHGSKIAQISDDTENRMSYDEMLSKTIRAAQNLTERGYKQNQVFGFLTKNSDNLTPIVLASFCLGCPINPLFPLFTSDDIIYSFKSTKPSLIFCDVEFYDTIVKSMNKLGSNVEVFTFFGQTGQSIPAEILFEETGIEKEYVPTIVDVQNDTALIVCTSGTTGRSKKVTWSQAAIIHSLGACFSSLNKDDTLFSFCSLYWVTGILAITSAILNGSTRVFTKHNFIPELQLKIIEKYKITYLWNVPYEIHLTLTNKLSQTADLSSMKIVMIGGAKLSSYTKLMLDCIWPNIWLQINYGMTETGPITINKYVDDNISVGRLVDGCIAKIVDFNDCNGNHCGVGIDGEICVKFTKYKFLGYLNAEAEADKNAFDEEGFFKTGDIGHFDKNGDLFLHDRKKEFIKYTNLTISPTDMETFLIKSVAVVGIPNEETEELPAALIVRNTDGLTEQDVHKLVSGEFPDFMMLRGGIYFVDSLPRTPKGKLKRYAIRELAIKCFENASALA